MKKILITLLLCLTLGLGLSYAGAPISSGPVSVGGAIPTVEVDPIVGAVTGIVEADGAGNITAATPDVDYLITLQGDIAPTAPLTGGADNVLPGADVDVVIAIPAATNVSDGYVTAAQIIALETNTDKVTESTTITCPDANVTAGIPITFADTGIMGITEAGDTITFDATELDSVVGAITGIVKSDGAGNILAATAGVDYDADSLMTITTHSATENVTAATMYKGVHKITGAYTVTLPSAVIGMSGVFRSSTAAEFSLDCNGSDHFEMYDGTVLDAGDKQTSSSTKNEFLYVYCESANTWITLGINGAFTDGS